MKEEGKRRGEGGALSSAACLGSGPSFLFMSRPISLPALAPLPLMLLEEPIFGFDHVTKFNMQIAAELPFCVHSYP